MQLFRRRRWRSRTTTTSAFTPKPGAEGGGSGRTTARRRFIVLLLLICVLFSVQSFIFIEKNLRPPLMNIAKVRMKQIAAQTINTAISESVAHSGNLDRLIEWRTDHSGKTTGFTMNYAEHMKIAADTVRIVDGVMAELRQRPESIPLGQALNSAILASIGPSVGVKFVPAGAARVELDIRNQNAGINMVLIEVYIRVTVEVSVVIPFKTDIELVETEIPVSYVLVVGDTPMYYFDNKGNPLGGTGALPPTISLPQTSFSQP